MASPKQRKKFLLFIIEDDEVLLRALYLLFRSDTYTIATATDGETATDMAQRLRPDLILLDLLLPKRDGFKVLEILKADPKLAAIPVIVLSNLGDEEHIAKAKEAGAVHYFVKAETDLAELKDVVQRILTAP